MTGPSMTSVQITAERKDTDAYRPNEFAGFTKPKEVSNWLQAVRIDNDTITINSKLTATTEFRDPRSFQAAVAAGLVLKATGDRDLANRAAKDIAHKTGDVQLGILPLAYASSDWLNGVSRRRNGWEYFNSHAPTAELQSTVGRIGFSAAMQEAEIFQKQEINRQADGDYWANRPANPAP